MLNCQDLRGAIAEQFDALLSSVDDSGGCTVTLPWIDDLGEPIRIAVTQRGTQYRIDDDGAVFFALGRSSGSGVARARVERFVQNFFKINGLTWNPEAQIAEMEVEGEQLQSHILHFTQIIGGCLTSLPVIMRQLEEPDEGTRSLGPRLATTLTKRFSDWAGTYPRPRRRAILNRLRRGHVIEGRANPTWRVDFFYEPVVHAPADLRRNSVVVITVDLHVKKPLAKAEHAVTMCRDLALTRNYTVRLPFVGDAETRDTRVARQLIEVLAEDTYQPFNLDDSSTQTKFDQLVRSELVGEPLF